MHTNSPKVSIIIPFYNSAAYIKPAISSVLAQTFTDYEIILINDCSTDACAVIINEALKNSGARFCILNTKENSGAAAARNIGVKAATGRYIAFLDADDIWNECKLEKQLAFAEQNGYAFTFTDYEYAAYDGTKTGVVTNAPHKLTYKAALKNTSIFTSTVMLDTKIIAKDDICMPNVKHEDTALWWALLKKYGAAHALKENLVTYRRAKGSLSYNKLKSASWAWRLYRKTENFNIFKSAYYFFFYALNAALRRMR